MSEIFESLAVALLRTTLVTSVAALLSIGLLALLRVRRAKTHRWVWLLVIGQGWLLCPYTWQMEVEPVDAFVESVPTPATTAVALPTTAAIEGTELYQPTISNIAMGFFVVIGLWSLGGLALVATGVVRYARLIAGGRPGEQVTDATWLAEWDEVRRRSRTKCRAEFRITRQTGPLVCWIPWVLLVLVPQKLWEQLASGQRLAILRHELAHCERGDLWKNLVVRLLALPQWFNPLVWLAVRRFEEAGEWACDEQVACSEDGAATDYARVLVSVADYSTTVPCGAVGLSGGVLSRRVKRLLHLPNKEVREMRGILVPLLLLGVAAFQVVRIERVEAEEPAAAPTTAAAAIDIETTANNTLPKARWLFDRPYVIETPDIVLINLVKLVPKSPHKVEPFDGLVIRATGVDSKNPIDNFCPVSPEGLVDLGPTYGKVKLVDVPMDQAGEVVRKHLAKAYPEAKVTLSLGAAGVAQLIIGEHLVGPDGRIELGRLGSVYIHGLTLDEAKQAVEKKLSEYLVDPQVKVDVFAYNSKKYYIIEKSNVHGDCITTAPVTGNETVLDALAAIGGLRGEAKVWIDRPEENGKESLIKRVDSRAIAQGETTSTNYQLLPGDRLFVEYKEELAPQGREDSEQVIQPGGQSTIQAYTSNPTTQDKQQQVTTHLRLVTDPKLNLRDIEGLQEGASITGETSVLEGLLRVMAKNGLSEVLSAPSVTTSDGQVAQFSFVGEELSVKLVNHQSKNQVTFEVEAVVKHQGEEKQIATKFTLGESQSILLRLTAKEELPYLEDLYLLMSYE